MYPLLATLIDNNSNSLVNINRSSPIRVTNDILYTEHSIFSYKSRSFEQYTLLST